ncbi:MAG TPA: FUSC family protein [Aeromicrobium sp.]|nr:FUSC family protein [Aeromicrobium sp.]
MPDGPPPRAGGTPSHPARDILRGRRVVRSTEDSLAARLDVLRHRWRLLIRLSVGTGVSYFIANNLLDHQQAFFAPIAAVITLIASGASRRLRTMVELVAGVSVGVLVGELLILGIGRGPWQVALVVVLAVSVGTLVGLTGLALNQAATSSVLLAAVVPVAGGDVAVSRFIDALVGGLCGMAMVLLVPRNVVRDIDREVQRILTGLAAILRKEAHALRDRDSGLADDSMADAQRMSPMLTTLTTTATNVSEVARISPIRWRQRAHVELYTATVIDLDNAVRDARTMGRKISALLRHGEPVPAGLDDAVDALASAVEIFADDLSERDDFDEARRELIEAARMASVALPEAATMNSAAIAAQIRSLAADLMYASGYTRDEIDERMDF